MTALFQRRGRRRRVRAASHASRQPVLGEARWDLFYGAKKDAETVMRFSTAKVKHESVMNVCVVNKGTGEV